MKLIFAGTPEFAATALDALVAAGFDIALVLTQPDRPAGRSLRLRASAVKERAVQYGFPLLQPDSLKSVDIQGALRAARADAMVVAAYGLILPAAVLQIPARGCINIHASLLPRWRGAAPIQRAILAGDRETGITIMQMDAGLDTGDLLLQQKIPVDDEDTAQTLHDKLAHLGGGAIVEALRSALTPAPQDGDRATYAAKITKAEAVIDWQQPTLEIWRKVRAFNPSPGAVTAIGDTPLKIWRARPFPGKPIAAAGSVLAARDGISVATRDGTLLIEELQLAGGSRLSAAAFAAGHQLAPGTQLGRRA